MQSKHGVMTQNFETDYTELIIFVRQAVKLSEDFSGSLHVVKQLCRCFPSTLIEAKNCALCIEYQN